MTPLQDILTSYKKSCPTNGFVASGTVEPTDPTGTNERRDAWQKLIDEKLIEWGRHPEQFEDEDGYKAPSADNLVRATELVAFCRDRGVVPPLRMAPDGEGGIVFDWRTSSHHILARIHADGGMEVPVFQGSQLVTRERIGSEMAV